MSRGDALKLTEPVLEVYLVTDRRLAGERDEAEIVLSALRGGVRLVQYREKELSTRRQIEQAGRLLRLARQHQAFFLVNDRVDVALAIGADGVHLGQEDLPLPTARRLLGRSKIIGVSVQSPEEARWAEAAGADYLGISAVFPTSTKPDADAIGLEGIRAIRSAVRLPLVAIGGINMENAAQVIKAGADGVAVVSAIVGASDPQAASARLRAEVQRAKRG